jgi:hypothetical protein
LDNSIRVEKNVPVSNAEEEALEKNYSHAVIYEQP